MTPSTTAVGRRWAEGLLGPRYSGPVSDHFDGRVFRNQNPAAGPKSFRDVLRWVRTRQAAAWPRWVTAEPGPPPVRAAASGELRVTLVNHATILIQVPGCNLLTDPVWSHRASPVSFAGPPRHRPPGIRFQDLPPIDAVLVSHSHYDHLDIPTLRRLARVHSPRFLVGLGLGAWLAHRGVAGAQELDWWQQIEVAPGVQLTATPAQHWSNRRPWDRNRSLWLSSWINSAAGTLYFAGDTGLGPHFSQIRQRFGAPDLALLPIGAYLPRWFMRDHHMSPADAVEAHARLDAKTSIAIHHATFRLTDEGMYRPAEELVEALKRTSVSRHRFRVLAEGESLKVGGSLVSA